MPGTRWFLAQPGHTFSPMKTRHPLPAGCCWCEPCSSLCGSQIPIIRCNCQGILLGFNLINCQGKAKTFSQVASFQSRWISQGLVLQFPEPFLQSAAGLPLALSGGDVSLVAEDGQRCAGLVQLCWGLAGKLPALHMYFPEKSLPKHSTNWKAAENL